MRLAHFSHTVLTTDPRSLQILLGLLCFACGLLWVMYLALNSRAAIEGFFAMMNGNIIALVSGAAR